MIYRKEIDGLRALAILPVLLFHAGVTGFSGGFVGVDVFFVISGFLITSLILAEKADGVFSLTRFYERRARRILPALFFVMLLCLPFGWVWMLPYQLKEFSQSLVSVSAFASNILFWKQSSYFDASAELKPLLHTWSLAVEEQYYLIFPLFLIGFWSLGRRWLVGISIVVALASLGYAQWMVGRDSSAAFYLLPTRGWELLIGALIPMIAQREGSVRWPLADQLLSITGLAMIVFAIAAFDVATPFPSIYALVPTMGAALVLHFATARTLVGRMFQHTLLSSIGLISYSLYLWHQPILAFYRIKTGNSEIPAALLAPYLAIVFACAYFSYHAIEKPFRKGQKITRTMIFSGAAAGIIFFGALGLVGHISNGFLAAKLAQLPAEKRSFVINVANEQALRAAVASAELPYLNRPTFVSAAGTRKILIVGDSMAGDLATALAANKLTLPGYSFRLLSAKSECIDSATRLLTGSVDECTSQIRAILQSQLLEESDLIILTALWLADQDYAAIETFIGQFKERNASVLILGSAGFLDIPSISYKVATADHTYTQQELDELVAKSRRPKFDAGNAKIKAMAARLAIPYQDRHQLYCNAPESRCRILLGDGKTLIWDNAHLTVEGMRVTSAEIKSRGWLEAGAALVGGNQ